MSKKLLIVDDDLFVMKTIQNSLTEEECKNIDFCESPEEAIEKMSENEYKRIVSDWRFPESDLNGIDILIKAGNNGIEERVLMTSVSKIKKIDDADSFCAVRKPLSKAAVISMCYDEFETLDKLSSICR